MATIIMFLKLQNWFFKYIEYALKFSNTIFYIITQSQYCCLILFLINFIVVLLNIKLVLFHYYVILFISILVNLLLIKFKFV